MHYLLVVVLTAAIQIPQLVNHLFELLLSDRVFAGRSGHRSNLSELRTQFGDGGLQFLNPGPQPFLGLFGLLESGLQLANVLRGDLCPQGQDPTQNHGHRQGTNSEQPHTLP